MRYLGCQVAGDVGQGLRSCLWDPRDQVPVAWRILAPVIVDQAWGLPPGGWGLGEGPGGGLGEVQVQEVQEQGEGEDEEEEVQETRLHHKTTRGTSPGMSDGSALTSDH